MLSKKHKAYLRLNIISILFTVISFISATLAWFAYSGLVAVKTEIGVRAWYIEFEKNNEVVSNDVVISASDIHPGMEPISELITIKNLGDSDAKLRYSISEARILDEEEDHYEMSDTVTSGYIEDALSHNYPFHINISLSKYCLKSKESEATFEVSISWPLDSGDDILDSTWGRQAFIFENKEKERQEKNPNYKVEPSIKVVINVEAEQVVDDLNSEDSDYQMGTVVLYDVKNNKKCSVISDTCLKTNVLDLHNLKGDNQVRLLPSLNSDFASATNDEYINKINEIKENWNTEIDYLSAVDILKMVSTDIKLSNIKKNNISDAVIGSTSYQNRANEILEDVINSNGNISFSKDSFPFFNPPSCIWTIDSYNDKAYALEEESFETTKLYGIDKNTSCKVVPVIIANKSNL